MLNVGNGEGSEAMLGIIESIGNRFKLTANFSRLKISFECIHLCHVSIYIEKKWENSSEKTVPSMWHCIDIASRQPISFFSTYFEQEWIFRYNFAPFLVIWFFSCCMAMHNVHLGVIGGKKSPFVCWPTCKMKSDTQQIWFLRCALLIPLLLHTWSCCLTKFERIFERWNGTHST